MLYTKTINDNYLSLDNNLYLYDFVLYFEFKNDFKLYLTT